MTASLPQTLTLEEFLNLPALDGSPAWEYVNGQAIQKTMPKTRHSVLQKRLLREIDDHSEVYTALPELRCTFGGRSIVPDVAVIAWHRIPINAAGEPDDHFTEAPDWAIEILPPDQKATRVIDNLLHSLQHGCQLGWMIDPDDYSVMIFIPQAEPEIGRGDRPLKVLEEISLTVTAADIFSWLQIRKH